MKKFKNRLEYFKVQLLDKKLSEIDPSELSFEMLLNAIFSQSELRIIRNNDNIIRLQNMETLLLNGQHVIIGELVKIRMDNIPPAISISGEETALPLTSDQGLAERTMFLFDPSLNILCYQANRYAVSLSRFLWLLKQGLKKHYDREDINPDAIVILERDAFEKVNKMSVIRKLSVGIAIPKNGAAYVSDHGALKALAKIADSTDGTHANIEISSGRSPKGLKLHEIIDIVQKALHIKAQDDEQVKKLSIWGKDSNDARLQIDLLQYRLQDYRDVLYTGRSIPLHASRESIISAYEKQRPNLVAQFWEG